MTYDNILVYVAGPYTSPDPVVNTHLTAQFATALYQASDGLIVSVVPHLSMLWHAITPLPYENWLAIDLALVDRCDAVVRLPGASSGADGEIRRAEEMGIPVIYIEGEPIDPMVVDPLPWVNREAEKVRAILAA